MNKAKALIKTTRNPRSGNKRQLNKAMLLPRLAWGTFMTPAKACVPQSDGAAALWYRKAAEQDYAGA